VQHLANTTTSYADLLARIVNDRTWMQRRSHLTLEAESPLHPSVIVADGD
jgi:hypothetical protein